MRILGRLSKRVRNEFAGRLAGAALLGLWMSFGAALNYTIWAMKPAHESETNPLPTAFAFFLKDDVSADGFPEKECVGTDAGDSI